MNTDCNYAVQLKNNGNLVRGTKYGNNVLNGAAVGGSVQEIDPQGNIVWEYVHDYQDASWWIARSNKYSLDYLDNITLGDINSDESQPPTLGSKLDKLADLRYNNIIKQQ